MAKRNKGLLTVLVVLTGLGLAAAGTAGAEEPTDDERAGLIVEENCTAVEVVDVQNFIEAWGKFLVADRAAEVDLSDLTDIENLLIEFLDQHFPECFPPAPKRWITNVPDRVERSWDEILEDMATAAEMIPSDFEGAVENAPYDMVGMGYALTSPPTAVVDPYPSPEPNDTQPDEEEEEQEDGPELAEHPGPEEEEHPLPTVPGSHDEGDAATGLPSNLITASTIDHFEEVGLTTAMEPNGTLSPQQSTVFVLYDPDYPQWPEMENRLLEYADAYPEVLFVAVSLWDTHKLLGLPQELGSMGYALQSTNLLGEHFADSPTVADIGQSPPSDKHWDELLDHTGAPSEATSAA